MKQHKDYNPFGTFVTTPEMRLAETVACPYCGSPAGQFCAYIRGHHQGQSIGGVHKARLDAAKAAASGGAHLNEWGDR